MSWIPGWDSVASANSWSNFYFWAGIVALLALGVFEVFSHRYTERKDELAAQQQEETQRRHDEEMARLHLEIAQANERAAAANQKAEEERLARVKLQTQLAWRFLARDQKARIIDRMKQYANQRFTVVTYRLDDPEASNLSALIRGSLEAAAGNMHSQLR